MKKLLLCVALFSPGCAWFSFSRTAQEDKSIRFPSFHEQFATPVGGQGQLLELDGAMLKAISIAANDFVPPGVKPGQCEVRQESQRYRAIRQGDLIFVEVSADPSACGMKLMMLDWGAKYAIRADDGRILRRLLDGEPDDAPLVTPDAGEPESNKGAVFPESQVGGVYGPRATTLPSRWFDGGTEAPETGSPPVPLPQVK